MKDFFIEVVHSNQTGIGGQVPVTDHITHVDWFGTLTGLIS